MTSILVVLNRGDGQFADFHELPVAHSCYDWGKSPSKFSNSQPMQTLQSSRPGTPLRPSRSDWVSDWPAGTTVFPLLSLIGPLNRSKRVNLPAFMSANLASILALT